MNSFKMVAIKKLKDLVRVKPAEAFSLDSDKANNPEPQSKTQSEGLENELGMTVFQQAYGNCKNASGNAQVLGACLDDVYEKFLAKCKNDDVEQEKLNAPFREGLHRVETEISQKNVAKEIKAEELEVLKEDITEIKNSISEVKSDPAKFGVEADKRPKAQFYLGLFMLLPITVYLVVFYMSASFSAFFKDFEDPSVSSAIFDANSLVSAYNDGWMEVIFVLTIPFAFMGLGYLIHMFQKDEAKGSGLKIMGLLLITFVFDLILAYQIENKIYNLNKTFDDPPFNFQIALTEPSFWGIIFAGFVVYLIWGFVLDFVMKEYENIDKIKAFIRDQKERIKHLETKKQELSDLISEINLKLAELQGKAQELRSKIDGFIFPKSEYLTYHASYKKGWYMAITTELSLPHARQEKLLAECELISENHLRKVGISENDALNTVYTQNID